MKKKNIKNFLTVILLFILSISLLGSTLEEDSECIPQGFLPSSTAGWALHPERNNYHMGSKITKYNYADEIAESYSTYIDAGKALWGDFISMSEVEDDAMGVIDTMDDPDIDTIAVCPPECHNPDPDNHYHDYCETGWEIIINIPNFDAEDRTYKHKIRTIAHEIGHIYGLADLFEGYELQIMYKYSSASKDVTGKDEIGMEICTDIHTEHDFSNILYEDSNYCVVACSHCGGYIPVPHQFTSTLVPVGTQSTCRKTVKTCSLCGYSYVSAWDHTHTWTDKYDATCNDCGYTITVAVEEDDGLLTTTIDGQSWDLNSSGTGNELQYNTSYNLPDGRTLTWNNVGDSTYNRYCYNYGGLDYIYGDQYTSYPARFANLAEMTKVERDEYSYYKLRYILTCANCMYRDQWIQTTKSLQGGFYAYLFGNEEDGYYVTIYRVLVDGAGEKFHDAQVWSPSRYIPVYFSLKSHIFSVIKRIVHKIISFGHIVKSVFIDRFTGEVKFYLKWGGSDLDLTLKRPDGVVIDPEAAQADPNMEYVESDTYEYYVIKEPMTGEWEAIIDAIDVTGEESFTLDVLGESPEVSFNVYTDKAQYTYPESILIRAEVVAVDHVANAEVTGTVETPDGTTASTTLYDDGLESHGDEFSNDGIYSNYFAEYTENGTYTFNMVVENTEGVQANPSEVPPEGWTPQPISPFTREASVSVTVSGVIEKAQTELILDFPSSIQYSDMLSGKATLTSLGAALQNMLVEFSSLLPTETLTTNEAGEVYNTPYKIEEIPGTTTNPLCTNFYGDPYYLSSYSEKNIEIEKENATLTYIGDTLVPVGTNTTLSCQILQEDDGYPGDITYAGPVTFSVTKQEGFSETYTAPIGSDGIATVAAELPVGLYTVVVSIDSSYYTADPSGETILAVYDPEGSFVTGGGWFIPEGSSDKVNFDFEVKYKVDGSLKGSLEMIDHSTGTNYKANDFNYLVVVDNKAYIKGNLTINGEGLYPFTAVIEDNGSPGKDNDKFSIDIEADGEHLVFNEVIEGGNIVIHK